MENEASEPDGGSTSDGQVHPDHNFSLERERLEIKRERLGFEEEKSKRQHALDKLKIKWVSSVVAVVLPLIGAVGGWANGWFDFALKSALTDIDKAKSVSEIAASTSEIEKNYLDSF